MFRDTLANDGFRELASLYVAFARFCGILILDNHSRMRFLESAHRRRVSRRKTRSNWGLRPSSLFFSPLLSEPHFARAALPGADRHDRAQPPNAPDPVRVPRRRSSVMDCPRAQDDLNPRIDPPHRGGGHMSGRGKELPTAAVGDEEFEIKLVLGNWGIWRVIHLRVGANDQRGGYPSPMDTPREWGSRNHSPLVPNRKNLPTRR